MPFLSPKTLHVLDRVMWMLPFATVTDLNDACKRADVSHEARNTFLQKMLDEHSADGSREQLKTLWLDWVQRHYRAEAAAGSGGRCGTEAVTPTDSESEGQPAQTDTSAAAAATEYLEPAAAGAVTAEALEKFLRDNPERALEIARAATSGIPAAAGAAP